MAATETKSLRRDARNNIVKLQEAARKIFLARGLDAPLDEIARNAGVSVGTLYNRFGSREALIDSVIPDIAGSRLRALGESVAAHEGAKERLEAFVTGMIDIQLDDPALNDAILRRFPDATTLVGVCDISSALGEDLVRQAHRDGVLSEDFTSEDLFAILWLAGTASRSAHAPARWRQSLQRALEAAWTS
ncbi:TetR/AcrR family transcriptional regulator [Streptomyces shenzhenensis]|uniref:TetR/AcrR family transcriptional regulator n=1 Tax=Streptomyces shenzhenensis TaxID=943815 RepID=UPI0033FD7349